MLVAVASGVQQLIARRQQIPMGVPNLTPQTALRSSPCDECQLYYNPEEKIAFYYPMGWRVEDLTPFDSLEPFVRLSPWSAADEMMSASQTAPVLYLGGPAVFSTSGSICIDPSRVCGGPTSFDLTIMDRPYTLDLFGLYPIESRSGSQEGVATADFYRFQIPEVKRGFEQNNLYVTGQVSDAIALEEVMPIISSIQSIDIPLCNSCPVFAPPPPGWCAEGYMGRGETIYDSVEQCYCPGAPTCLQITRN